jgi:hypothetical protein
MRPLSASTHLEDLGHRLPHLPLADAPVAVDVQVEEGLCRLGWGKKVLQVCSREFDGPVLGAQREGKSGRQREEVLTGGSKAGRQAGG